MGSSFLKTGDHRSVIQVFRSRLNFDGEMRSIRMMKTSLAFVAAFILALSSALAHDECSSMAASDCNAVCSKMLSKLDLTADQKTKLETARQECMKAGCNKESMEKFMQTAKGVLSPEQYAQMEKNSCCKESKAQTKS
jgi:Spy/CpxP family protein refolding chaperone